MEDNRPRNERKSITTPIISFFFCIYHRYNDENIKYREVRVEKKENTIKDGVFFLLLLLILFLLVKVYQIYIQDEDHKKVADVINVD